MDPPKIKQEDPRGNKSAGGPVKAFLSMFPALIKVFFEISKKKPPVCLIILQAFSWTFNKLGENYRLLFKHIGAFAIAPIPSGMLEFQYPRRVLKLALGPGFPLPACAMRPASGDQSPNNPQSHFFPAKYPDFD